MVLGARNLPLNANAIRKPQPLASYRSKLAFPRPTPSKRQVRKTALTLPTAFG